MIGIFEIMQGIGDRIKDIFPKGTIINVEIIPQGIDHQSSMSDYIDIHLYKAKPVYTALNEMRISFSIGIMCVCNAPLDPKRTAQEKAFDMAQILQIYMGYHDNDVFTYVNGQGYNWTGTGEIEIDKESDMNKGSSFFDITLELGMEIFPKDIDIKTFCKKLYDYEDNLGGTIVLS